MFLVITGKQIITLQASLALLDGSTSNPIDPYSREPFRHPALRGVEILSTPTRDKLLAKKKVSALAVDYGLHEVLRWLPRKVCGIRPCSVMIASQFVNVSGALQRDRPLESGLEVILNHTMFATVGAIALERGGLAANEVARDRILTPLGFPIDVSTS